jgi:hypothetical protein
MVENIERLTNAIFIVNVERTENETTVEEKIVTFEYEDALDIQVSNKEEGHEANIHKVDQIIVEALVVIDLQYQHTLYQYFMAQDQGQKQLEENLNYSLVTIEQSLNLLMGNFGFKIYNVGNRKEKIRKDYVEAKRKKYKG